MPRTYRWREAGARALRTRTDGCRSRVGTSAAAPRRQRHQRPPLIVAAPPRPLLHVRPVGGADAADVERLAAVDRDQAVPAAAGVLDRPALVRPVPVRPLL